MDSAVHIAAGAGFAGDRWDLGRTAAEALAGCVGPRYLIFETLAERTLALSRQPGGPERQVALMRRYLEPCLPLCAEHGVRVVTNVGASDPVGVARAAQSLIGMLGLDLKVGVALGDALPCEQNGVLGRNAYVGAQGIVAALKAGANVVITGRVADPSLVVGPVMLESGLAWDDWDGLALATLAGHLIECSTQITGGYFADPNGKPVPNLTNLGPPVASVDLSAGDVTVGKPRGGGCVTEATVKEQLLYEIHDPGAYLTPDVVMDLNGVTVLKTGPDRVTVAGVQGKPRPATLKTLTFREAGWVGEGEISYYGDSAQARALMARDILTARLAMLAPGQDHQIDVVGLASVANDPRGGGFERLPNDATPARDLRVRLALAHEDKATVELLLSEVDALYLNGPAGGGGVRMTVTPRITSDDGLVPQEEVHVRGGLLEDLP